MLAQETEFSVSYYYFWEVWVRALTFWLGLTFPGWSKMFGKYNSKGEGVSWHTILNNPKMAFIRKYILLGVSYNTRLF